MSNNKKPHPFQGGARIQERKAYYAFSLRRRTPAKPTRPVPISVNDPGSGTVEILVSPLEISVDPLKKPLPVLIVNWTVAPFTQAPLYQVPASAPDNV
jgi:hypothetical protein